MTKLKKSLTGDLKKEGAEKKTRQGDGRRSKANHRRKKSRGQG